VSSDKSNGFFPSDLPRLPVPLFTLPGASPIGLDHTHQRGQPANLDAPGGGHYAVRMRLLLVAASLALAVSGCGSAPMANPAAMVGTYDVMIAGKGKTDPDTINVTVGSGGTALLNFVYIGFSQIRAGVSGSTGLSIPRQVVKVGHSTGTVEGPASGMGMIAADGTVNIALDVSIPGMSGADAGASVTYTVTGSRRD
jgi:hypothetical protein